MQVHVWGFYRCAKRVQRSSRGAEVQSCWSAIVQGCRGGRGSARLQVQRFRGADANADAGIGAGASAGAEVQMWRSVGLKMSRGGAKVQSRG